jgi:hypothetical protein
MKSLLTRKWSPTKAPHDTREVLMRFPIATAALFLTLAFTSACLAEEPKDGLFLFCIKGLEILGERMSDHERVFMLWTRIHGGDVLKKYGEDAESKGATAETVEKLRRVDKEKFLELGLVIAAQLRGKGKI